MTISIHQFACLSDNYGFLVRDETSGLCAAIDTPDADAVLSQAQAQGWSIDFIFNTHWHPDHAGGNAKIKEATGARIIGPAEVRRIAPLDQEVAGGERIALGATIFEVIATGGHTLQHVSYLAPADGVAFVGDTLFALGCGRLFEGDARQMWESLQKLAALPDDTEVYCAHEYTASNARFALSVDPSEELAQRSRAVFAAREAGRPTVPTTIALEKATNPFLRAPLLAAAVGAAGKPDHEAFAAVRAAKDAFKG